MSGTTWIDTAQAGKLLFGISGERVRQLAKEGTIKGVLMPGNERGRWRINRDSVLNYRRDIQAGRADCQPPERKPV